MKTGMPDGADVAQSGMQREQDAGTSGTSPAQDVTHARVPQALDAHKSRLLRVLLVLISAATILLMALAIAPAVRSALPRPRTAVSFAPAPLSTPAMPTANPNGIPINTATLEELMTLPGIGPVTAQAIITARETHPFLWPEDLKAVPGIGDRTLEKIRELIRVP